MKRLTDYRTFVFDCDGVILDSNRVKTEAFYQAALPYGERAANALVDYHVENGGVSRYEKFDYFLREIVPEAEHGPGLKELLSEFANHVRGGLGTCEQAAGLAELRDHTSRARWLVASGGDQEELREVFKDRALAHRFDGGIFGSPDAKQDIVLRESASGRIQFPALFLGDSKLDWRVAQSCGLDFVFIHGWTEVKDWAYWARSKKLRVAHCLQSLLREDLAVQNAAVP